MKKSPSKVSFARCWYLHYRLCAGKCAPLRGCLYYRRVGLTEVGLAVPEAHGVERFAELCVAPAYLHVQAPRCPADKGKRCCRSDHQDEGTV
jgi:hypothetical protein